MPDEIQGLSAEITANAAPLLAALEKAEAALRAFDSRWGHTTVQIAANLQLPNQQALVGNARELSARLGRESAVAIPATIAAPTRQQAATVREQTQRLIAEGTVSPVAIEQLRAPAGAAGGIGGRFISPVQAAALSGTPLTDLALRTHDAQLAQEIGVASTQTRGGVREAIAATIPQASVTIPVAGEPSQTEIAQERANRLGRAVQFQTATGLGRVFPQTAGPVGEGERPETVGEFALPLTRGIRGAEEAGATPTSGEIIRSLSARVSELEGQLGRGAPAPSGPIFDPRLAATGSQFRGPGGRIVAAPTDTPAQQALVQVSRQLSALSDESSTFARSSRAELQQTQQFLQQIVRLPARQQIESAQTASLQRPAIGGAQGAVELLRQISTGNLPAVLPSPPIQQAPVVVPRAAEPVATAPRGAVPVTAEHTAAFANVPYGGRRIADLPPDQQQRVISSLLQAGTPVPQIPRPLEEVAATGLTPTAGEVVPARAAELPEIAEARAQRVTTAGEARVGSLRSTISSLFFTLSGARGKVAELEDQQRDFTSRIVANIGEEERITKRLPDEFEQVTNAIGTDKFEELNRQYEASGKRLGEIRSQLPGLRQGLAGVNQELKNAGTGGSALAASFAGGVAGGLAFSVAMQGVTAVVGLVAKAFDPAIERATGFTTLTNNMVSTLADQSRALHGSTDLVVAASFAQSGLSENVSNTIRPLIEQRVAIEAGNKALGEQIDQINAAAQLQHQQVLAQGGQAVGLGQTPGAIPGFTTGTGGFLNTPLFQTPGIIEQLARLTPQGAQQQRQIGGAALGAGAGVLGGAIAGGIAGSILPGPGTLAGALIGGAIGGIAGGGIGAAATGTPSPNNFDIAVRGLGQGAAAGRSLQNAVNQVPVVGGLLGGGASVLAPGVGGAAGFLGGLISGPSPQDLKQAATQSKQDLDVLQLGITNLDDAAKRGAPNVEALGTAVLHATAAQADATANLLKAEGATDDQIKQLRAQGFALLGPGGTGPTAPVATAAQAQAFATAAQKGAALPTSEEALATTRERTLPAAIFQAVTQAALQRQVSTAQIGIQAAQQPLLPLGTSIPGGIGSVSPGIRGLIGNTQNFDTIQVRQIQAAQVQIAQIAGANGTPGFEGASRQAVADFGAIQAGGRQIAGIQAGITQEQVGLQTAQFDEQIRQQSLALNDLAQITGKIGQTAGDNLGIYERQAIVLGRQSAELQLQTQQLQLQSQALQIQLAQRQINFQVAVAGFAGGPGATPEERAARQEEAKQEASYAQKQLDIQKEQQALATRQVRLAGQILPITFRIEDIQHNRDYISARNALGLLERARQVTIDTAGAQEAIAFIQARMQAAEADLQQLLQQGEAVISAINSEAAKYVATYKKSTETLEQSAAQFFQGISSAFGTAISQGALQAAAGFDAAFKSFQSATQGGLLSGTGLGYGTPNPGGTGAQIGYLGNVSTDTLFHAGEAGTEKVAVLAQPRDVTVHPRGPMQMTVGQAQGQTVGIVKNPPSYAEGYFGTMGQGEVPHYAGGFVGSAPSAIFGGGGITINITITGNQFQTRQDEARMRAELVRAIEQSLARKTSLLGFRGPSPS